MKVVVGASSFGQSSNEAIDLLRDKRIEVVLNPFGRKMTEDEIIEHIGDADGLLAGLEPLNENVFSRCKNLKAVSRIGIGMDNVDIEAAKKYGIAVSNTPDGPTEAVAEMTLAALLAIEHNLVESNADVHKGIWKKRIGHSISELTILVIGYGRIGRAVSSLLSAMGANVMIYDKYLPSDSNCTLDEGLKKADVITIHASGNNEILSEKELKQVKNGAVILNSARGKLINETALFNELVSGHVGYYWGDALWEEPYSGPLIGLNNVLLTPHICTYTTKCRLSMEKQAVINLLRDLNV